MHGSCLRLHEKNCQPSNMMTIEKVQRTRMHVVWGLHYGNYVKICKTIVNNDIMFVF